MAHSSSFLKTRSTLTFVALALLAAACGSSTSGAEDAGSDSAPAHDAAPSKDTGAADSGHTDAAKDTGAKDTGAKETSTPDAGISDTGTSDTGTSDTGTSDTGTSDTGTSDGGSPDAHVDSPAPTFAIGGTVTGLPAGDTVVLLDEGGDALSVTANGAFTFATHQSSYAVTVGTQPTDANCVVTEGSGVATAAVTSVVVTCTQTAFTIGGTVGGLPAAASVTLENNGASATVVSTNGTYSIAGEQSGAYDVTVSVQPAGEVCTVMNGSGPTLTAPVTDIDVSCVPGFSIGGNISGIPTGQTVVLEDNGGNDLTVTANGAFTFTNAALAYAVTVKTQPTGATCYVENGAGTATAKVTNVTVACILPGALDTTFGNAGWVDYEPTAFDQEWYGLVVNADNSLTLGGFNQTAGATDVVLISELLPSGAFNTAWGAGQPEQGSTQFQINSAIGELATGIRASADGHYYLVATLEEGGANGFDIGVLRFTSGGLLDTTYGVGGVAVHNLAGNDTSTSMILESDGSVIAAGYNGSGTTATGTLIRFTPAGVLDTTFGTGGVFTGAAGSEILDVTGDSTGKIYAAGSAGNDALVQRFTSAGVLDTSFGNAGTISKVIGAGPDVYSRVLLDASGNIVLDGTTTIATAATEAQLVRLTPTAGALDNTFGTGGTAVLTNPATVTIHALRIQADGKILFGGGSGQNAILGRVTTAGALDTTFATAGVYSARIDGGSVFTDIQIDSLGRIVVCGSFGPINQDMSAARFAP